MPSIESSVDSTKLWFRQCVPDGTGFGSSSTTAPGLTLVFLHGWPMSSSMWEHLLIPLCESYSIQCIAPDRRGFGKSDWNSLNMIKPVTWETFTEDLVSLLKHLDVGDFVFVGASMGCPESVLAYCSNDFIRLHCQGFVWLGPIMPFPTQTLEAPLAPTRELWSSILEGFRADRAQYVSEALPGVFALKAGNMMSPKSLENFERIVAEADGLAIEKTVRIFNTPVVEQLKSLAGGEQKPILILHGDSDQGMPIQASAEILKKMLPWSQLKVYEKGGHGIYFTHSQQVLEDVVSFVHMINGRSSSSQSKPNSAIFR